jgi:hypothetical protein
MLNINAVNFIDIPMITLCREGQGFLKPGSMIWKPEQIIYHLRLFAADE